MVKPKVEKLLHQRRANAAGWMGIVVEDEFEFVAYADR
jgi:hypothetical protein